jgi:hypothetical protein
MRQTAAPKRQSAQVPVMHASLAAVSGRLVPEGHAPGAIGRRAGRPVDGSSRECSVDSSVTLTYRWAGRIVDYGPSGHGRDCRAALILKVTPGGET